MSDLAIGLQVAGSQLESFGRGLVDRLGPLNFWTAVLLGSALLLDRALSRRARASWRIALYAPVALRILLPLDWTLKLASAPRVVTLLPPILQVGPHSAAEPSTWHAPSWHALAAVVYVVVAALLAAQAVLARVRLTRALAGAQPFSGAHPGVSCSVMQHDDLGPMAVGLFAPRIILPLRLLVPGEEHALDCVMRHEAAHLRRRDGWLSVAMQLLAIVAWPVVPMWIAVARVRQLVELACDEAALAGADDAERRRYGHTLLDMAEWRSLGDAPLGTGALHFGSTLRARVEALASQRHWPPVAQVLVVSLAPMALLAACGGAVPPPAVSASAHGAEDYGYKFEVDSAKYAGTPATALPNSADGRVPPETIQAAVRSHYEAFNSCYLAGLKRDPKLTGTVAVKYVFGEDGVTKTAAADSEDSTLPDKGVADCVVAEFRKVSYPRTTAANVTVVYPIQFAP